MESSAYHSELSASCPDGWQVVPLSEVAFFQEGPGILAKDFHDQGVPLIRLKGVEGDFASLDGCNYLDPERVAAKWSHFKLDRGDLIISTSASFGRVSEVTQETEGAIPYTGLIRFRPSSQRLDRSYLRAFLSSAAFLQQVEAMASGSVIRHFGPSHLKQMALHLPPLEEQRAIGQASDLLADRLRLLRETNVTLEAIAQTLFKSWFVDFDPVRAKAEGREPEGMDVATAALFPSEFEESEVGLIPKGWQTQSVYETAQFINGAAYKAFSPNTERRGLPIIKIAELKSGVTSQTAFSDAEMPSRYHVDSGDILFSWSGNPDTSIDTFVWHREAGLLNQHIFRVVPSSASDRSRVLVTLKFLRPFFAERARNKQTTGLGHVTVGDLKEMRVVLPSPEVVASWNRIVDPLMERALITQVHVRALEELRDTLLPRLISGRLRLPEAEAVVEDL